jgi:hypothetical protein
MQIGCHVCRKSLSRPSFSTGRVARLHCEHCGARMLRCNEKFWLGRERIARAAYYKPKLVYRILCMRHFLGLYAPRL